MASRKPRQSARSDADAEPATEDAGPSSVLYIGHIPHGFYEKQMKEYFSQFGKVSKLRISRSKKTGNSKHYAFLEFQSPDVAKIASDAMDGYMFFGQKLQVRVMHKNEVHRDLFKGANRVFKKVPWKKIETERQEKVREMGNSEQRQTRSASRRERTRQQRIKEAGIEYDFTFALDKPPSRSKKTTFNE